MMKQNPRPIPLDNELIKYLATEATNQIVDVALGRKKRFTPITVEVDTVTGAMTEFTFKIKRSGGKKRYTGTGTMGAYYKPFAVKKEMTMEISVPTVSMQLTRAVTGSDAAMGNYIADLSSEIGEMIRHEMTHARDIIRPGSIKRADKRKSGGLDDYVNSAHEVRAYARNIADKVARYFRTNTDKDAEMSGAEFSRLVARLSTPGLHWHRMNEESRQYVLRVVLTHLEDEGIIEREEDPLAERERQKASASIRIENEPEIRETVKKWKQMGLFD